MPSAGTFPEAGVRVAFDLRSTDDAQVRYHGEAFTPSARYELSLVVEVATGKSELTVEGTAPREAGQAAEDLEAADVAFIKALGMQLWRQAVKTPAEQGGGHWSRRIQRWRGPK